MQVGDIVQVLDDEEIPCDLVVMSCSDAEGTCYITTANLDGETNLKVLCINNICINNISAFLFHVCKYSLLITVICSYSCSVCVFWY